jgi:hypothetical protein
MFGVDHIRCSLLAGRCLFFAGLLDSLDSLAAVRASLVH